MRVGVYLGRHGASGGGMSVYAQAFVVESCSLLNDALTDQEQDKVELVFYGDHHLISDEFLENVASDSIQIVGSFKTRAGKYFSRPSNQTRRSILYRRLPNFFGRRSSSAIDQILMWFYRWYDSLVVVHATTNQAQLLCRGPQVVTVHDLFQGWPELYQKPFEDRTPKLRTSIFSAIYRRVFKAQFSKPLTVLTCSKSVAKEIETRFPGDHLSIVTVPTGLDRLFTSAVESGSSGRLSAENVERTCKLLGIEEGYVLVLASADPRKNLTKTLDAWKMLSEEEKNVGLVILLSDGRARKQVELSLAADLERPAVTLLERQPRENLPILFRAASVLCVPTLAEGYGLPSVEALSVGTALVSARLEILEEIESSLIFYCNPKQTAEINDALTAAIAYTIETDNPELVSGQITAWPTMRRAVNETLALYKEVELRYKAR